MNGRGTTRRAVLAAGGALGAGVLAGCLTRSGGATADVLSAGSLSVAFDDGVGPAFESATEYGYRGEFHGSNAVMRMIKDGQKHPDVVVSADASLLRAALEAGSDPKTSWDVVFAGNEVGVTYDPGTRVGKRLAAGEPWYEVLRSADAAIGRSDPTLDPLGYRTVMLFELAERYYGVPGLAADLRANLRVDPAESHLLAAVETGDRAAAVAYANMAVDHGLPFVHLPAAIDFASPAHAKDYATATYRLPDGTVVHGKPVVYAATVLDGASHPDAGRAFVGFLVRHANVLRKQGLVVTDAFPMAHGSVPSGVAG